MCVCVCLISPLSGFVVSVALESFLRLLGCLLLIADDRRRSSAIIDGRRQSSTIVKDRRHSSAIIKDRGRSSSIFDGVHDRRRSSKFGPSKNADGKFSVDVRDRWRLRIGEILTSVGPSNYLTTLRSTYCFFHTVFFRPLIVTLQSKFVPPTEH